LGLELYDVIKHAYSWGNILREL